MSQSDFLSQSNPSVGTAAQHRGPPRRSDARSAKIVYHAILLRRAFGRRAAWLFLLHHRLARDTIVRVLNDHATMLRR